MKVLDIYWLECDTCEDSVIQVTTEMGDEEWFYQGDTAICKNCKNSGVIEAEDGIAWVVWEEVK